MSEYEYFGHKDEVEDFWKSFTYHLEDYEEKYAKALGINIENDGTWWFGGEENDPIESGDLDDSLRDFILKRIKELVGA